jgi:hypothetical protein
MDDPPSSEVLVYISGTPSAILNFVTIINSYEEAVGSLDTGMNLKRFF